MPVNDCENSDFIGPQFVDETVRIDEDFTGGLGPFHQDSISFTKSSVDSARPSLSAS